MNPKKTKSIVIFSVVVVVALAVAIYFSRGTPAQTEQTTPSVPVTSTPVATVPTANKTNKYKNGVYSATGTYESPAGLESIGVSLTLTNDVVTSVSVTQEARDGTSVNYQNKFISGYKQYVIGQSLDSIDLIDAVSGSSLTPHGFNDAVAQIKTQAVS